MHKIGEKIVAFLPQEEIEREAMQQIENTASMSFVYRHVAVMPDTHYGKGSTVGTVLATKGAIIPAAVGVDIGCGMIAVETNLMFHQIADKLHNIRLGLERRIPMSAGKFHSKISVSAQTRIDELQNLAGDRDLNKEFGTTSWEHQIGTLGGGNHFIELCVDPTGKVWATLHSGSRGIGNKIGMHYIRKAQALCRERHIELPDPDLAYFFESDAQFNDYIRDMQWAQKFALLNREEMMDSFMMEIATQVLGDHTKAAEIEIARINCHHNFTQQEEHMGGMCWVTRKGAIKADIGDWGMIPGSMGTRSYIVRGKAYPASFNSAPHGAGRRMSRTKAKAAFTMADFDIAMEGIEHRRSEILLDELPAAYKDIDHVMENAKDLVEVVTTLKQVLNVKGD